MKHPPSTFVASAFIAFCIWANPSTELEWKKPSWDDGLDGRTERKSNTDDNDGTWKCCVDPLALNPIRQHRDPSKIENKRYSSRGNPSNFSYFYEYSSRQETSLISSPLNPAKWANRTFSIVGGSTSRQMYEQLQWEMPQVAKQASYPMARFLFQHKEESCCTYDASHVIDIRDLAPGLKKALLQKVDYIIFNVGTWWSSNSIGRLIDLDGVSWNVGTGDNQQEWSIVQDNTTNNNAHNDLPDVSFAALMEHAIHLILKIKAPQTTLVWRSETKTDCSPIGHSFRGSIAETLHKLQIPILNISAETCRYAEQALDDSAKMGPHLCFPSVALRLWLVKFQNQFLLA
jgi:hypothetical protein